MNLYKILNIDKSATDDEIRQAYKKGVLKWHPDKNPDPNAVEHFRQIQEAYEILGTPSKRHNYDFPEPDFSFKSFQNGPEFFFKSFRTSNIFMNRNDYNFKENFKDNNIKIVEPIRIDLPCKLEELYNGFTKEMKIVCNVVEDDVIVSKPKIFKVVIPQGCLDESLFTIPRSGNEKPNERTSDVVFKIKELEHKLFKREGLNLIIHRDLNLLEALNESEFSFTHLNGKLLKIPMSLEIQQIQGLGMRQGNYMGNLFIKPIISMPKITSQQRQAILQILKDS